MKDLGKSASRRAILSLGARSIATAGVLGTLENLGVGVARASSTSNRALVCIYLFGGEGGNGLIAPLDAALDLLPVTARTSQAKFGLNPAFAELRSLYEAQALAGVVNVGRTAPRRTIASTPGELTAQQYSALRFLPNGFATPAWAARLAGINSLQGTGAFTFRSGMSVVSLGASSRDGGQFENPALRDAMNKAESLRTSFPASALGRQLADVASLLQTRASAGMSKMIFLCTAGGFTSSARLAGTITARHQELSNAMTAFYSATVELGLAQQVTTFTDAEFPMTGDGAAQSFGARLIAGGSVLGGDVYSAGSLAADNYLGSIAGWFGVSSADLKDLFPEFQPPGIRMLA
jgi:uncharacterized protein (DUF1501 family)